MKKIIALVLVLLFALSSVAMAAEFKDMPDDWSTAALTAAVENGLLGGSDGYIKPSDNMTRAEMATIMVRACGATKAADISGYTDLSPDDWYYSAMAMAVEMGAFTGSDNKLNPESPITRQEAFLVLSRVFGLNTIPTDTEIIDTFKDGALVSDWARDGVAAIINYGYVGGNEGYLNPLNNISRAEFAVVMDRMIKYYIDDAADAIPTDGNVMIRTADASLADIKTDKMIVIGDGVGQKNLSITGADINKLVIRGGKAIGISGNFFDFGIVKSDILVEGSMNGINYLYICKGSTFSIPSIFTPTDVNE